MLRRAAENSIAAGAATGDILAMLSTIADDPSRFSALSIPLSLVDVFAVFVESEGAQVAGEELDAAASLDIYFLCWLYLLKVHIFQVMYIVYGLE